MFELEREKEGNDVWVQRASPTRSMEINLFPSSSGSSDAPAGTQLHKQGFAKQERNWSQYGTHYVSTQTKFQKKASMVK